MRASPAVVGVAAAACAAWPQAHAEAPVGSMWPSTAGHVEGVGTLWQHLFSVPSLVPILAVLAAWLLCRSCLGGEKKRESSFLGAFGFARYLGALHIVLFHAYREDHPFYSGLDVEVQPWMSWGFCWVTFYFILSGFMMTYSRYIRPDPHAQETVFTIWRNGMSRIYPAYFLSILLGLRAFGSDFTAWRSLPASLLLVQSWGRDYSCTGKSWLCVGGGINEPAWFISTLQFHYLAFAWLYGHVARCSERALALTALGCWAFTPVASHLRTAAVLPPCNPLLSLHQFAFGMCLCRFFVDRFCSARDGSGKKLVDAAKIDAIRPWAQCQVLVGYSVLFLLFTCSATAWPMPLASLMLNHVARNAVLIPVFAILILGLAFEADPIARLFKKVPLVWGDLVSYEVYVLQRAVIPLTWSWAARPSGVPLVAGFDSIWAPFVYMCLLHLLALLANFAGSSINAVSWGKALGLPVRPAMFYGTMAKAPASLPA